MDEKIYADGPLAVEAFLDLLFGHSTEERRQVDQTVFLSALNDSLHYREREILKLRLGFTDGFVYTPDEVGHIFRESASQIWEWEEEALSKLVRQLEKSVSPEKSSLHVSTKTAIEATQELTPYLIAHLKNAPDDLRKLPWDVFEHLVAEFLAERGYTNVSIVGRNPKTAADIFAMKTIDRDGTAIRIFVEVKRWERRVGVEVVDRVIGAMLSERENYGWHLAMIVSVSGFTEMHKYNASELRLKGVELRDGDVVKTWLDEYEFSKKGLWLPNPFSRDMT